MRSRSVMVLTAGHNRTHAPQQTALSIQSPRRRGRAASAARRGRASSCFFAAERIDADDMTVRVQAKGKTRTGRLWTYVRDDRPFGRPDPPAAAFFYSPDRGGEHPESHLAYRVALRRKYSPSILPNNLSNHPQQPKATHCISPPASMKREIFLAPLDGKSPAKIEALYVIESLANDGLRSSSTVTFKAPSCM